ncbi:MAG: ubiquitin-conjugating enzyme E2 [Promethearchaeota archaeon]
MIGKKGGWSPSKNIKTVINSIISMLDLKGQHINPYDVFNKKAAMEYIKSKKMFDKKVRHLVKKYANQSW